MEGTNYGVVYFDGVCNLCNGFVDWLIRHDPHARLRFASLQSDVARQRLPAEMTDSLNSIVFESKNQIYKQSSAALRAIATLGGIHKAWLAFLIVPPFLRNSVYNRIAKNRYNWFGKQDTCRLPSPDERTRFL